MEIDYYRAKAAVDCIVQGFLNQFKIQSNGNLKSIFLVGSMAKDDYKLKRFNDLDIRFLFEKVDARIYTELVKVSKKIALIYKSEDINIDCSFLIGPAKLISGAKYNILIHNIVLTPEILNNLPSTHKYSYSQNYKILVGEDCLRDFNGIRFDKKEIVNSIEGIDYCLKMISSRRIKYGKWGRDKDLYTIKFQDAAMTDEMLLETICYSLKKGIANTITWLEWNNTAVPRDFFNRVEFLFRGRDKEYVKKLIELADADLIYKKYKDNMDEYKDLAVKYLTDLKGVVLGYEQIS